MKSTLSIFITCLALTPLRWHNVIYLSMVWSARYIPENQIQIKQSVLSNHWLILHRSQLDYCIFCQDICLAYFRNSTLIISSIPVNFRISERQFKIWDTQIAIFWNYPWYNHDLKFHILLQQTRCRRKIVSWMDWSTYQWIFPYFVDSRGSNLLF